MCQILDDPFGQKPTFTKRAADVKLSDLLDHRSVSRQPSADMSNFG